MSETRTTLAKYLENHPRMIGALFMLLLLLVQAGTAVANNGSAQIGP